MKKYFIFILENTILAAIAVIILVLKDFFEIVPELIADMACLDVYVCMIIVWLIASFVSLFSIVYHLPGLEFYPGWWQYFILVVSSAIYTIDFIIKFLPHLPEYMLLVPGLCLALLNDSLHALFFDNCWENMGRGYVPYLFFLLSGWGLLSCVWEGNPIRNFIFADFKTLNKMYEWIEDMYWKWGQRQDEVIIPTIRIFFLNKLLIFFTILHIFTVLFMCLFLFEGVFTGYNTSVTQYKFICVGFDALNEWRYKGYTYTYYMAIVLDQISLIFILMTVWISIGVVVLAYKIGEVDTLNLFLLGSVLLCLLLSFVVNTFISLFMIFESSLIPLYVYMLVCGLRSRKFKAAYYLFVFTVGGSVLLLISISTLMLMNIVSFYDIIYFDNLSTERAFFVFITGSIGFGTKIPVFPFHIWLPEAHVEAPTIASIILASIILKIGIYGLIRLFITLRAFEGTRCSVSSIFLPMCGVGCYYSALLILRQVDIKRIFAYFSISHMNLSVFGLFCNFTSGYAGAVISSVSHALVSASLFTLAGILYRLTGTKNIFNYSGLIEIYPLESLLLFISGVINAGFPLSLSFIGEFMTLLSIFHVSTLLGVLSVAISGFLAVIGFWMFHRIIFGSVYSILYRGLEFHSTWYIVPLLFWTYLSIGLGCFPSILLTHLELMLNYSI